MPSLAPSWKSRPSFRLNRVGDRKSVSARFKRALLTQNGHSNPSRLGVQNEFILIYSRSGSWGTHCLSPATVRPFAASGPRVWGHSRFSPATFGPRAGHLSVQHFTLHQPGQGRQGLSFVAEGAAAFGPATHFSLGKIPPPRRGSTDGSKQRLQGFCSTDIFSSLLQKGAMEEIPQSDIERGFFRRRGTAA